jgi:hypothetical protein
MGYKIQKGVPISERFKSGARVKYPFTRLEIGDSFVATIGERRNLATAAQYWKRKKGWRFKIAKISERSIRVWRTE